VYMHPYSVAKIVASIAALYQRRLYLNMVAGGFKNDLNALDDPTEHDQRYGRLVEYTQVITQLLGGTPVTFQGTFYKLNELKLLPSLPPDAFPGIFVSGSSSAGLAAAKALGATAIMYPKPPNEDGGARDGLEHIGVRVGIIARDSDTEAWRVAR